MARPCHPLHDDLQPPGVCHWCDLYRTDDGYRRLWDGTPAPPSTSTGRPLCLHLGAVVPTESQRTHYHCEKGHGTVCPCKQCQACADYEPEG